MGDISQLVHGNIVLLYSFCCDCSLHCFYYFFPNDWLELTYLQVSARFQECIQNKKMATVCDRSNMK
jgi:hypothetical protein